MWAVTGRKVQDRECPWNVPSVQVDQPESWHVGLSHHPSQEILLEGQILVTAAYNSAKQGTKSYGCGCPDWEDSKVPAPQPVPSPFLPFSSPPVVLEKKGRSGSQHQALGLLLTRAAALGVRLL